MKPIRCKNGHYYDADLYKGCPHCDGAKDMIINVEAPSAGKGRGSVRSTDDVNAEKKERRNSPFLSFLKVREKNEINKKTSEVSADFEPYECEPTVALSEYELKSLLERDRDSRPSERVPEPADLSDAFRPIKIDDGSDETEFCEGKNVFTGNAGRITERHSVESFTAIRDNASEADKSCGSSAFICPETVGIFNAGEGENEPCVGWLTAVSGAYRGRSFELKPGGNFIGRSPENDIVLKEDNRVSRFRHVRVTYEPRCREFYIEAGESGGLAYLNGKNILHHAVLSAGDLIEIGGGCYIFVPLCSKNFSWSDYPPAGPICPGIAETANR